MEGGRGGWWGGGVGENVRAGENDLVKRQNQEPITLLTEWTKDETVIRVSCLHLYSALSYFLPLLWIVQNKRCLPSYLCIVMHVSAASPGGRGWGRPPGTQEHLQRLRSQMRVNWSRAKILKQISPPPGLKWGNAVVQLKIETFSKSWYFPLIILLLGKSVTTSK